MNPNPRFIIRQDAGSPLQESLSHAEQIIMKGQLCYDKLLASVVNTVVIGLENERLLVFVFEKVN